MSNIGRVFVNMFSFIFLLKLNCRNPTVETGTIRVCDFAKFRRDVVVKISVALVAGSFMLLVVPLTWQAAKIGGGVVLAFCCGMLAAFWFPIFKQRLDAAINDASFSSSSEEMEQLHLEDAVTTLDFPSMKNSGALTFVVKSRRRKKGALIRSAKESG